MADIVRIVDSISASPTVLLDLNDESSWWTRSLKAPPPRLRRSVAQNSMRDGDHDAASTYGSRILELVLESRESTQDAAATQMQTLFRLLDGADGKFLQYQPQGASKPVFFVLERSDLSDLADIMAQAAMRAFTVELKAEPFALGLMESLGPYTVYNDPDAVSNGCYFDIAGVLGDVASPSILVNTTAARVRTTIAARSGSAASSLVVAIQAEVMDIGDDTSNPGGGPDAAMSGTVVNNYMSTTFSTVPGMALRLFAPILPARGVFNVHAVVRRTDATSAITIGMAQGSPDGTPSTTVVLPLTTSRIKVPLGIFAQDVRVFGAAGGTSHIEDTLELYAGRTSGTGALHWDCILISPADESTAIVQSTASPLVDSTGYDEIFDAEGERASRISDGATWSVGYDIEAHYDSTLSGRLPSLKPGVTNRIVWFVESGLAGEMDAALTNDITAHYWPRYLYVRPVSS